MENITERTKWIDNDFGYTQMHVKELFLWQKLKNLKTKFESHLNSINKWNKFTSLSVDEVTSYTELCNKFLSGLMTNSTVKKAFESALPSDFSELNPDKVSRTVDRQFLIDEWEKIKKDREILEEAMKLELNKFGKQSFIGYYIVNEMLADYEQIDPELSSQIADAIYSDKELASTVVSCKSGSYSYAEMALWNFKTKLTQDQKDLVLSLARTGNVGTFLRYWILKNPNFKDHRKELIFEFYPNNEEYSDLIDELRWAIVNDTNNEITIDDLCEREEMARDGINPAILEEIDYINNLLNIRDVYYITDEDPDMDAVMPKQKKYGVMVNASAK